MRTHTQNRRPNVHKNLSQQGVSLLELSIVLVIIGLLVGGTMSGVALMRSAELRAILDEYKHYESAVTIFKSQYGGLPGDILDATVYWQMAPTAASPAADDAACAALTSADPSEGTRTCNGNGDGRIRNDTHEDRRAWQHLANAGMIDGKFTGVPADTITGYLPGENIPKSAFRDGGWLVTYIDTDMIMTSGGFDGDYESHYFTLVGGGVALNAFGQAGILTAAEMAELDKKHDDGMPATGKIITLRGNALYAQCTETTPGAADTTTQTDISSVYRQAGSSASMRKCVFRIEANF